jgi:AraC-like DNA-binding protein
MGFPETKLKGCSARPLYSKGKLIKKDFYTLPQAMYHLDEIEPILIDGNNSILHKTLNKSIINAEKIIISHSIVYVVNGAVKVSTYNYDNISISNGEMLFMPRDSYLISDYISNDKKMEAYILFFDYKIASDFLKTVTPKNKSINKNLLKLNVSNNISHYFKAIKNIKYKDIHNKQLLNSKLLEFLHLIAESNNNFIDILYQAEMSKYKFNTEDYMIKHYDKNLAISDWASLHGKSLSTFNRMFKKRYGISPKKWMLKQNMSIANKMLKDGSSVSQCSAELGYSNTSNFIKAYKEIYLITPKQHINLSN